MKFGQTHEQRFERAEDKLRRLSPGKWYAWYPVVLVLDGSWVWREYVWRVPYLCAPFGWPEIWWNYYTDEKEAQKAAEVSNDPLVSHFDASSSR
jgi:hypothetical protein